MSVVKTQSVSSSEGRRHLVAGHSAGRAVSTADLCSAVTGCVLVAASLAYLWTDLTYDEAVYLELARTIAETGLPWRRVYENFSEFRLFGNSPPLLLYLASVSQMVFPGNEIPARLVQFFVFAVPSYLLVWWVTRSSFGSWAACASLLTLLTMGSYVRDTTNVLLNIPLGLLACVALLAFYQASSSTLYRRWWLAALALAFALAVWTKYQAVVIAAAIALYVLYTVATRGRAGVRAIRTPFATSIVSGAIAAIALIGFFWAFSGREGLASTLAVNANRIDPTSMSMGEIAYSVVETARECERTLGAIALLLGASVIWVEPRHRGLLLVLAAYVVATIAFNLAVFRLPGAGSSYLDSAVPALAMLVGPAAVRFVELAPTRATRTLVAVIATAVQFADSPSTIYDLPRPNGSRVAARYIAANSQPNAGVLADTVAIDFYTGRPVRATPFTYPRELVLRSLEGTSGDDISFVVVEHGPMHRNLAAVRPQWDALLAEHFELVPTGAPGLDVYRRRTRNSR